MSIFENTLKPEEEIGGFIPGQDGDDIFHLEKLDSYAGDLPDFEFKDPAVSDIIKPRKDKPVDSEAEEADEEIEDGEILPDEGDSFMNSPAAETKKQEATGWGQDYYESEEEEEIAPPVAAAAPVGLVIEDDELKALLASELDRTSERRKMREYTKTLEEENASKPSGAGYDSPFGDVPEFMEHPEVLDFEEIKADKPSQYGLKELDGQSHTHTPEPTKEESSTEETKEDKKKKKKRMPLWQIITYSAVAALLLLAGIGWGVYKFMNSELTPEQKKQKELADKKEQDKKKGSKIAAVKPAEPVHTEPAPADAEHTEETANAEAEHPTDEHAASAAHSTTPHDAPATHVAQEKHSSTPANTGHGTAKETGKNRHDIAIGKPGKKDSKHSEPEHITPKTRRETASHSTSRKSHLSGDHSESVAHSSSKKSSSKSIGGYSDPSKSIIARKIEVDEKVKPLYSVQIYASPSKEDAEDWMMKLKRLKVSSIRMDTQKVRGELWHRVRFGEFDSKEDARNAAIKLGFAQSWIDRIK